MTAIPGATHAASTYESPDDTAPAAVSSGDSFLASMRRMPCFSV